MRPGPDRHAPGIPPSGQASANAAPRRDVPSGPHRGSFPGLARPLARGSFGAVAAFPPKLAGPSLPSSSTPSVVRPFLEGFLPGRRTSKRTSPDASAATRPAKGHGTGSPHARRVGSPSGTAVNASPSPRQPQSEPPRCRPPLADPSTAAGTMGHGSSFAAGIRRGPEPPSPRNLREWRRVVERSVPSSTVVGTWWRGTGPLRNAVDAPFAPAPGAPSRGRRRARVAARRGRDPRARRSGGRGEPKVNREPRRTVTGCGPRRPARRAAVVDVPMRPFPNLANGGAGGERRSKGSGRPRSGKTGARRAVRGTGPDRGSRLSSGPVRRPGDGSATGAVYDRTRYRRWRGPTPMLARPTAPPASPQLAAAPRSKPSRPESAPAPPRAERRGAGAAGPRCGIRPRRRQTVAVVDERMPTARLERLELAAEADRSVGPERAATRSSGVGGRRCDRSTGGARGAHRALARWSRASLDEDAAGRVPGAGRAVRAIPCPRPRARPERHPSTAPSRPVTTELGSARAAAARSLGQPTAACTAASSPRRSGRPGRCRPAADWGGGAAFSEGRPTASEGSAASRCRPGPATDRDRHAPLGPIPRPVAAASRTPGARVTPVAHPSAAVRPRRSVGPGNRPIAPAPFRTSGRP